MWDSWKTIFLGGITGGLRMNRWCAAWIHWRAWTVGERENVGIDPCVKFVRISVEVTESQSFTIVCPVFQRTRLLHTIDCCGCVREMCERRARKVGWVARDVRENKRSVTQKKSYLLFFDSDCFVSFSSLKGSHMDVKATSFQSR